MTIVVPVLITNCQLSQKWNSGPTAAQRTITKAAPRNAHLDPNHVDAWVEKRPKESLLLMVASSLGFVATTTRFFAMNTRSLMQPEKYRFVEQSAYKRNRQFRDRQPKA